MLASREPIQHYQSFITGEILFLPPVRVGVLEYVQRSFLLLMFFGPELAYMLDGCGDKSCLRHRNDVLHLQHILEVAWKFPKACGVQISEHACV
jgi:hypothetical protein